MRKNAKIGVLILAGGSSSRLGYPKQLVKFKGTPLLQHCIEVVQEVGFDIKILVLGANSEEIEKEIDPKNFKIAINENWEEGMSTSIRKGILEALKFDNDLEHILILLSDQPLITLDKILELIKIQLDTNMHATFSEYANVIGVPAIFSRKIFPQLIELKGDEGAKKIVNEKNLKYGTVKFENGNFDVDTIEDVKILKQMEQGSK